MERKWFGWAMGGLMLFSAMLVSAAAPKKEAPKTAPAKIGDPSSYWWYKNEVPYLGKEINKLAVGLNEEVPLCIQALDSNGRDTGVCPVEWKSDNATLAITPIPNKCNAVKIKGLKASDKAYVTVVYKGAKGNKIEATLKGNVGPVSQPPQNSPAPTPKPAPPPTNKNKPK